MGGQNVSNTIYATDRTRFLPTVLKNDPSTLSLAQGISGQMNSVAQEIDKNILYPRIDYLSEEILDILAYDLHVDWYDYSHDIATKRRVIKNSVKIHMKMGTKYAVETATSDIYPNSSVEEWFSYGGDPYFFRMNIDISDGGITYQQQVSLYEKIMFYKNCRSHLDYFNFQVNLESEISLGGFASFWKRIEIKPFLVKDIDLENESVIGALAVTQTSLDVKPFLETDIALDTTVNTKGHTTTGTSLEVKPFLESEIDLDISSTVGSITKTEANIEVKPFLHREIDLECSCLTGIYAKVESNIDVVPFLASEIALETPTEILSTTKTETYVEIQPLLTKDIHLDAEKEISSEATIESKLEVNPFLVSELRLEQSENLGAGGQTSITQKIELKEIEE